MSTRSHIASVSDLNMSIFRDADADYPGDYADLFDEIEIDDGDEVFILEDPFALEAFVLVGTPDEMRQFAQDIMERLG